MKIYWKLILSPQGKYLTDRAMYDIGLAIADGFNHGEVETDEVGVLHVSNDVDWIYFPNGTPKELKCNTRLIE